jgi:tRNA pseudouridine55 synthase
MLVPLDPFATGVLLLGTGKATKKMGPLSGIDKEYVADVQLGRESDTFDRTGKVIQRACPAPDREQIEAHLEAFRGRIMQIPPMYSALKIGGQRLYKLARKGKEVPRTAREVEIHHLEVINYTFPLLTLRIRCSKGTYVRSLAHDLGKVLGCGALLNELKRTAVGEFHLQQAMTLTDFVNRFQGAECK